MFFKIYFVDSAQDRFNKTKIIFEMLCIFVIWSYFELKLNISKTRHAKLSVAFKIYNSRIV